MDQLQDFDIVHERFVTACRAIYGLKQEYSIACVNYCKNKCQIVTDPCQMGCLFARSLPGNANDNCYDMMKSIPSTPDKTLMGFIGSCSKIKVSDPTTSCKNVMKGC
jgi:hypothetical protein